MPNIGIVGIGLMGKAVGSRLIQHGYTIQAWNRCRDEAKELLDQGAIWSDNPVECCDRVIICLYNSQIVAEQLQKWISTVRPGQIFVDMTTGSPDDAVSMAHLLSDCGAFYLDAPVSGSSEQTRQGEAMIMVGGPMDVYSACQDLWKALGRSIHYTGENGSASRMKLVTNLVLGLNRAALAEGLAFASQIGVDPQAALRVLQDSAAASRVMTVKGEKMIQRDFSVQARLHQHLKDVRIILDLAAARSLTLPLSKTHGELLEQAQLAGYGEADNSAIICAYQTGSEPTPPTHPEN